MIDILIAFINGFLILIIYLVIIKFWDYRTKQKLIREGFVDEQNLGKMFEWNKKKELANLIKSAAFSGCLSIAFFMATYIGIIEQDVALLIAIIFAGVSAGAVTSFVVISKMQDKQ